MLNLELALRTVSATEFTLTNAPLWATLTNISLPTLPNTFEVVEALLQTLRWKIYSRRFTTGQVVQLTPARSFQLGTSLPAELDTLLKTNAQTWLNAEIQKVQDFSILGQSFVLSLVEEWLAAREKPRYDYGDWLACLPVRVLYDPRNQTWSLSNLELFTRDYLLTPEWIEQVLGYLPEGPSWAVPNLEDLNKLARALAVRVAAADRVQAGQVVEYWSKKYLVLETVQGFVLASPEYPPLYVFPTLRQLSLQVMDEPTLEHEFGHLKLVAKRVGEFYWEFTDVQDLVWVYLVPAFSNWTDFLGSLQLENRVTREEFKQVVDAFKYYTEFEPAAYQAHQLVRIGRWMLKLDPTTLAQDPQWRKILWQYVSWDASQSARWIEILLGHSTPRTLAELNQVLAPLEARARLWETKFGRRARFGPNLIQEHNGLFYLSTEDRQVLNLYTFLAQQGIREPISYIQETLAGHLWVDIRQLHYVDSDLTLRVLLYRLFE